MPTHTTLTSSFGGARLLAPHRLPDDLLIDRAINNIARYLARDPEDKHALYFLKNISGSHCAAQSPASKKILTKIQSMREANDKHLKQYAKQNERILHTICFMTNGRCDLMCEQCYTDQRASKQATWQVYESAIQEAKRFGAEIIYIAGEGEPFLDEQIGNIIRLAKNLDMRILLFSNGLQFCHETTGYRTMRARIMSKSGTADARSFVKWLAHYPVYIYLKMHSVRKEINSRMCGLLGRPIDYTYERVRWKGKYLDIPSPLIKFREWGFPIERLGFDAMVTNENAKEMLSVIGPWSQKEGYAFYCEPFIPSGRVTGNPAPSEKQLTALRRAGYLVRQNCSYNKTMGKIVVWGRGFTAPILAFTWRQLENRPSLAYSPTTGFMEQRDNHPLFQKLRYMGGCPCAMGTEKLQTILDECAPRNQRVT